MTSGKTLTLRTQTDRFNPFPNKPWFLCLQYKSFENTAGKEEIAHNEQFFLFQQCFLPVSKNVLPFPPNLKLSSENSFRLEESKICRLGKELNSKFNIIRKYKKKRDLLLTATYVQIREGAE